MKTSVPRHPLAATTAPAGRRFSSRPFAPLEQSNRATARGAVRTAGLPTALKLSMERLAGLRMDNVRVHYNSPQPARVHALAYTQGTDIHIAPDQEECLPHEAWHVAQQVQGRVRPTTHRRGMAINADPTLEHEAEVMAAKAMQTPPVDQVLTGPTSPSSHEDGRGVERTTVATEQSVAAPTASAHVLQLFRLSREAMIELLAFTEYHTNLGEQLLQTLSDDRLDELLEAYYDRVDFGDLVREILREIGTDELFDDAQDGWIYGVPREKLWEYWAHESDSSQEESARSAYLRRLPNTRRGYMPGQWSRQPLTPYGADWVPSTLSDSDRDITEAADHPFWQGAINLLGPADHVPTRGRKRSRRVFDQAQMESSVHSGLSAGMEQEMESTPIRPSSSSSELTEDTATTEEYVSGTTEEYEDELSATPTLPYPSLPATPTLPYPSLPATPTLPYPSLPATPTLPYPPLANELPGTPTVPYPPLASGKMEEENPSGDVLDSSVTQYFLGFRLTIGQASGLNNVCLIHSLAQLLTASGHTVNGHPISLESLLSFLVPAGIVVPGAENDVYNPGITQAIAAAFHVSVQVHQVVGHRVIHHPVIGQGGPVLHLLHSYSHFVPLWNIGQGAGRSDSLS